MTQFNFLMMFADDMADAGYWGRVIKKYSKKNTTKI